MNEAETRFKLIDPKLKAAAWETPPHVIAPEYVIAPGRITPMGQGGRREKPLRVDYLLRYAPNQTIAVLEAKSDNYPAGEGLQQAKGYAERLGLKFAYASNGKQFVEFDYLTGQERTLTTFPTPTEFKQIIGRGTRVREDHGKLFFTIIDYTGSAMQRFADPAFDGEPVEIIEEAMDAAGNVVSTRGKHDYNIDEGGEEPVAELEPGGWAEVEGGERESCKYYVDEGQVEIVAETVYELDADGRRLRTSSFRDYTGQAVRTLYNVPEALHAHWISIAQRKRIIQALAKRGIELDELRRALAQPQADPFDLLCHLAYGAPLYTRRQRAERLRRNRQDFFEQYGPDARLILNELLDKYVEHGVPLFEIPAILQIPPISKHGNIIEISRFFDDPGKMKDAVEQMQALLYTD